MLREIDSLMKICNVTVVQRIDSFYRKKYVLIVKYVYTQVEKMADVMLKKDKGSPKYMQIVLGIHQQANCCCLIENTLLEAKGKNTPHVSM